MTIKAIETEYNGYRFRSRLEARWAVFFDVLGIEYQYEPEGFDSDGAWYLPDFWLNHHIEIVVPSDGFWVEIKPRKASKKEVNKLLAVCSGTGHNGLILQGQPYYEEYTITLIQITGSAGPYIFTEVNPFHLWIRQMNDPGYSGRKYLLRKAYTAARQARFGT